MCFLSFSTNPIVSTLFSLHSCFYLGSSPADSGDFVIKEHTYTMCPGCPSFSIPIPIPKSNLKKKANTLTKGAGPAGYPAYDGGKVDYQSTTNKTFLEKIGDKVVTTWHAGFKVTSHKNFVLFKTFSSIIVSHYKKCDLISLSHGNTKN